MAAILEDRTTVLEEVKDQTHYTGLLPASLKADSVLVKGLEDLLLRLTPGTTLVTFLPNSTFPASSPEHSELESSPEPDPSTPVAKSAAVEGKSNQPAAEDEEDESDDDEPELKPLVRLALADLPVADETLQQEITTDEVIEAATDMIGRGVGDALRDALDKMGMSDIPTETLAALCESIGKFVGSALTEREVLGRFVRPLLLLQCPWFNGLTLALPNLLAPVPQRSGGVPGVDCPVRGQQSEPCRKRNPIPFGPLTLAVFRSS